MNGSFLIDTDDLDVAEEGLSANFAKIRISADRGAGPTRTRVWRSSLGALSVDDAELSYVTRYDMTAPDKILLTRVRSGTIEEQLPKSSGQSFGPGSVVAFGAHDGLPYSGTVNRVHYDIIAIDRSLLGQVAGVERNGHGPVRLTASAPWSAAANQHLVDAIDYVRHGVLTNSHVAQQPLMAGAVARYLAASLLCAIPNTAAVEPTSRDRQDTTPALLKRAIAFVDENSHLDIAVTDIAAVVDVTPRALQLMFRRHRDCTPMQYVRRVRLHHAHHELLVSSGQDTTVAAIARRWGFGNGGRFAVIYREAYGRSPNATLRR